jgi:hypothetical protein
MTAIVHSIMFQYSCLPFLAPVQPGGCLDYKVFYIIIWSIILGFIAGALASLTDAFRFSVWFETHANTISQGCL